jgi:hypothetical protein
MPPDQPAGLLSHVPVGQPFNAAELEWFRSGGRVDATAPGTGSDHAICPAATLRPATRTYRAGQHVGECPVGGGHGVVGVPARFQGDERAADRLVAG